MLAVPVCFKQKFLNSENVRGEKENYRDLRVFQIKKEVPSNVRGMHGVWFGD